MADARGSKLKIIRSSLEHPKRFSVLDRKLNLVRAVVIIVLILSNWSASAQTLRPVLTTASAKAIVAACEEYANDKDLQVVIAVVDPGEDLVAYLRMDKVAPGTADIALWKAVSAAVFATSTKVFGELASKNPAISFAPKIATLEGGEAIFTTKGDHIGGVGVSGALSEDDAACARAGIARAGLKHDRSSD